MQEIKGNIWSFWERGEWVAVTTNGICKTKNGKRVAVMGRGIALQAAERFSRLPEQLAYMLDRHGNHVYAFLPHRVFTFPTKNDWRDPSTLELIRNSCRELRRMAAGKVFIPRPGCENGRLSWNDVRPAVEQELPEDWFFVVSLPRK